jgi:large subunit ribosomal protein L5e
LDQKYQGVGQVDGKIFLQETPENGARPFKANLDVGLVRTTTGARVFGAMKGACDGGLVVPHSEEGKRFPGWNSKSQTYDPKVHRDKIFGKHVADYMKYLKKNNEKKYDKHFADFVKNGVTFETDFVKLYTAVHEAIRKDPTHQKKAKKPLAAEKTADGKKKPHKPKDYSKKRLTLKERKDRAKSKKDKIVKEIQKQREKEGLVMGASDEGGAAKIKKKDRVKQLQTKKPKAAKEKTGAKAAGGKTDAKAAGGKTDAKAAGGKTDAKAGDAKAAKPDAKKK